MGCGQGRSFTTGQGRHVRFGAHLGHIYISSAWSPPRVCKMLHGANFAFALRGHRSSNDPKPAVYRP
eukprot:6041262-Pyramimonas_sp.AAC.1